MTKPIIGITCHSQSIGLVRSSMVQLYVDAIQGAGGATVGIPLGLDEESLRSILSVLHGVVLPGGDDIAPERYNHDRHARLGAVDDNRDALELGVAIAALADDLPILGICRGIQVLAVAAGGTLYQDIPSEWESTLHHDVREFGRDHLCHTVTITPGTRLADAVGCTSSRVNSFHHQSVRDVPPGFVVTAHSDDGIVEAIEAPEHRFAVGVQSHPEGMWRTTAPEYKGLFSAFVEAARIRADLACLERSSGLSPASTR